MIQQSTHTARRNLITLTWLLVLPLFVDQTDVLDLVSGGLVLHDDGEMTNPAGPALPSQSAIMGISTPTAPALKVFYDQDSPSPLPIPFAVLLGQVLGTPSDETLRLTEQLPASSLYLLHRSLLL